MGWVRPALSRSGQEKEYFVLMVLLKRISTRTWNSLLCFLTLQFFILQWGSVSHTWQASFLCSSCVFLSVTFPTCNFSRVPRWCSPWPSCKPLTMIRASLNGDSSIQCDWSICPGRSLPCIWFYGDDLDEIQVQGWEAILFGYGIHAAAHPLACSGYYGPNCGLLDPDLSLI